MERQISSTEHMANREHFCDKCLRYIHPGEMYQRRVYLRDPQMFGNREELSLLGDPRRNRIYVLRKHVLPRCRSPWDDEDSEEYRIEREMEEEAREEAREHRDTAVA